MQHIVKDAAHMIVHQGIEHLLALPIGIDHPHGTQQTQMVTDQRRGYFQRLGKSRNALRLAHAGQQNPQPCLISKQLEGLG